MPTRKEGAKKRLHFRYQRALSLVECNTQYNEGESTLAGYSCP
ncbi:MAG: hypothetical protein ACTSPO_01015 [Candidatus Heimdallarchaeaceae archaeon]